MPTYDPYAEIVELYDLEHNDYFDDIELLVALAELGEGPILELGCGSGRVIQPLAEAGHTVIGIDASEPMLAAARARLTGLLATVVAGDMADMQAVPGGPFGMIIASLNSLMHLTTPVNQLSAITSAVRRCEMEVDWSSIRSIPACRNSTI
ncbi:MAG: class I SAM-dependent methyltransferase [Thermomicrobiales bacterium]|nr:class I SAM-dependent methyltransferase [Thermomicrobiales bacterium]